MQVVVAATTKEATDEHRRDRIFDEVVSAVPLGVIVALVGLCMYMSTNIVVVV